MTNDWHLTNLAATKPPCHLGGGWELRFSDSGRAVVGRLCRSGLRTWALEPLPAGLHWPLAAFYQGGGN